MDKKSIIKQYKKKRRVWTSNGRVFNTDYIIDYMTWQKSIFDIQAWPQGINKVEFDKLWDSDFVMSDIWETMHIIADYRAIEQAKSKVV